MTDTNNTGRYVWYELMTTDPKAAVSFYTELLNWKAKPYDDTGAYTLFEGPEGPLGGATFLSDEAKAMGAPPHWMANVEVDDVDAKVAKLKELGGKVFMGPADSPDVGRFAVVADPYGAVFALFKPSMPMQSFDTNRPGNVCWHELYTPDHNGAMDFYSKLLGWEKRYEHDMGGGEIYLVYGRNGADLGGIFTPPASMKIPPAFQYYFEVEDLEGRIEHAKKMGATLQMGPMEVPGGARVASLIDAQGAHFALHSTKKSAG